MCLKLRDTSLLFTLYRNRKLCANGNSSFLSLSETFRSAKNSILVFLKCSEAWKTSFWPFCSVQKREKSLFCLSAVCRSVKNCFLVFPRRAEAWKNEFWPFRATQLLLFYSFRLEILIKFEMSVLKNISTRRLFLFFFVSLLRLVWEQLNNYCNTS